LFIYSLFYIIIHMPDYIHQNKPVSIPVPGNKTILEHFGLVANSIRDFSVARMIAPPEWDEPWQTPDFDELTLMVKGKMKVETGEGVFELSAGDSFFSGKGNRVRYSNPGRSEAEYWAVCIPAFTPDAANRDE
jgi:mannose-6-phosphate isomerase-like protein (cupin superfamily)